MDRRPAADDARPSGSGGGAKAPARSSVGGSGQGGEGGSRHGSRGPDGRRASEPDRAGRDTRGPDVRRDTREGRDRDWDRERGRDRGRDREPHPRPSSAAGVRSPPGAPRLPASASPRPGASTPPDRRPPSGGGLRHSSLLADAARLVREKEAREAAAAKQARQESNGGTPPPATEGKRKGRWIDDDPEAAPATPAGGSPESSEAEDGELPQPAPAKRQRHEPVVWKPSDAATGDKSPGGGGQLGDLRAAALRRRDGVGSSSRLDTAGARSQSPPSQPVSRAAATAAPAPGANLPVRPPSSLGRGDPPRSAAEILAAELDAFRQTAGSDLEFDPDAPAAMKASPSASEGGDTPATAQPAAGREEGAGSEEEDGGGRASRWHDEDAADEPEVGKEAAEAENAVAALNARELASLDGSLPSDGEPGSDEDVQEGHVRGVSMLRECRSVEEFERLNRISEGTYGVVYRAKEKATGRIVALKKVKMDKERDGFPLTAIREVNILLSFHHASIVDVSEVVVGKSLDSVFMVMEFMEHDLKQLMEDMKNPFSIAEVKALMWQLFDGIEYLHDNWVLHRDLKTSNILYNNRGELKICDFGLARQYGSPLKPYTHMVVTLWYRCPELLLGAKEYSTAVDLWSLGCIMAELLSKEVLFDGRSELDQLDKIFKTLGSPNERIWPGLAKLPNARKIKFPDQPYNTLRSKFPPLSALGGRPGLSDLGFDLMNRLLTLDPEKRITAKEALNHEWFREKPLAKDRALMPTFPSRTEGMRQHNQKSPDPRIVETRRAQLSKAQDKGGLFSFPPK